MRVRRLECIDGVMRHLYDPAAAPPAEKLDVTQGILGHVQEQGGDARSWFYWIELRTLPAREYMRVVAKYDLSRLDIDCSFQPGIRVLGLADQPISIAWHLSYLPSAVRQ